MCLDLPRVEYLKTDDDGKVIKNTNKSENKKVEDLNRLLIAKMKAKQAEDSIGEKISLKEILEG